MQNGDMANTDVTIIDGKWNIDRQSD